MLRTSPTTRSEQAPLPAWVTPLALFVIALVARLLFARASADGDWPYSVFYKGDAVVWLQQVLAGRQGASLEAGLPLRPPATAWLIGLLWDGTPAGVATLKTVWCVLGAATVALLYLALVRPFGRTVAAVAGGAASLGSSGLVLASSLNNEAPYLFLALLAIALIPPSNAAPARTRLLAFGAVNALACLFRVEHALFFAMIGTWWVWTARKPLGPRAALTQGAQALAVFVLVLVPWHLEAWSRVAAMNRNAHPKNPAAERAIAQIEASARPRPSCAARLQPSSPPRSRGAAAPRLPLRTSRSCARPTASGPTS